MSDKQQKILQMAKDICRVKLNCNDVCNPISACDALRYAERAVEAGYSKQSGWISVEEGLPKQGVPVLVYKNRNSDAYGNMETAYFDNGRWRGACGEFITHWMPLPEAPKGGAE